LRRYKFWAVGFGFVWLGVFLTPVSNLVPMMQYMAERFLYLPLIGFLLALGALILSASRSGLASALHPAIRPYLAQATVGIVVMIWASLSWNRSGIWRDKLTLFVRSSLQHPRSRRVENNALSAIFSLPHMRALLPNAVEKDSLNIANAITRQEADPIIRTLTEAQRIFPDSELVSTILGYAYARSGQLSEAIPRFEMAARQNPEDPQCWINLAAVRMDNRENGSRAREACETALRLAPTNVLALGLKLQLCSDQQDYEAALACAKKLWELEPKNQAHQNRIHEIEKKIETATRGRNPP
jgi:tetratricopeptide (TPR) repeat protein